MPVTASSEALVPSVEQARGAATLAFTIVGTPAIQDVMQVPYIFSMLGAAVRNLVCVLSLFSYHSLF